MPPRTITATVVRITRAGHSAYGNPSWYLWTSDGHRYKTAANASLGYSVTGPDCLGRLPRSVTLALDGRDSIVAVGHPSRKEDL